MALILDTNALSAAADQHAAVVEILGQTQQLAIPVLALGEYRYGISQSRYKPEYETWLEAMLRDCRVLDVDEKTTHHYATIRTELRKLGKPIPTNDLWIAALCRQHDLPLLSRDTHFDVVPAVHRISW